MCSNLVVERIWKRKKTGTGPTLSVRNSDFVVSGLLSSFHFELCNAFKRLLHWHPSSETWSWFTQSKSRLWRINKCKALFSSSFSSFNRRIPWALDKTLLRRCRGFALQRPLSLWSHNFKVWSNCFSTKGRIRSRAGPHNVAKRQSGKTDKLQNWFFLIFFWYSYNSFNVSLGQGPKLSTCAIW